MTKLKVSVKYDVIDRKFCPDIDFEDEIKNKFESIGCKLYAKGLEITSGVREFCFDLEMP